MTQAAPLNKRRWGWAFIGWQTFVTLVFAISLGFLLGFGPASACILGSIACILPNMFLVNRLFAHRGARQAKKIVTAFYIGEAGKLILTAMLTGIILHWLNPQPGFFFFGFILAQSAIIWAPKAVEQRGTTQT